MAFGLLLLAGIFTTSVSAQTVVNICDRSAVVESAILAAIPGTSDCAAVTAAQLAAITELDLASMSITALQAGDFADLTGLTTLRLQGNTFTTALPADIFDPLPSDVDIEIDLSPIGDLADVALAVGGTTMVTVSDAFISRDSAGDDRALSFTITPANTAIATATESGGVVSITAIAMGMTNVTITADDGGVSNPATQTISVTGTDMVVNFCDRTDEVETAILAAIPANPACDAVTATQLATIDRLDLSNMSITTLQSGDFVGLSGLTTLSLSGNALTALLANIFNPLASLTTLNLESNNLNALPANIFDNLASLTELDLGPNNLSTLPANIFNPLTALTTLDLANNSLNALESNVFSSLTNLEGLTLQNNSLIDLPTGLFSGLTSLNTLRLQGNTFIIPLLANLFDDLPSTALIEIDLSPIGDLQNIPSLNFGDTATIDVSGAFISRDADGNNRPLTYTATPATPTIASVSLSGATGTITAGTAIGGTDVSITANDGINDVTRTVSVTVLDTAVNICDRTPQVESAILAAIPVVSPPTCDAVTATQLAGITNTLDLSGMGISALQADDFAGLTGLTILSLSNNSISTLPAGLFSDLRSLTFLNLSGNTISTPLPDNLFDSLTSLTQLNLSGNNLSALGSNTFSVLTSLTQLHLNSNSLNALPAGVFDDLANLTFLNLSGNNLGVLEGNAFSALGNLTTLGLANNSLNTLPTGVFSALTSLTTLDLANNSLDALESNAFSSLTMLSTLRLQGNTFTTPLPANLFGPLPDGALIEIDLTPRELAITLFTGGMTTVDDAFISRNENGHNRTLTYSAIISNNNAVATAIESGGMLTITATGIGTTTVSVTANDGVSDEVTSNIDITVEAGMGICSRTAEVQNAILAAIPATNDCTAVMAPQLAAITSLNLSNDSISTLQSDDFADLSGLTRLDLAGNDLTVIEANTLSSLTNLTRLDLSGNGLTMLEANTFSSLSSLAVLNLRGNGLTMLEANAFFGLMNLATLFLDDNSLTTLPANIFSSLTSLTRLDLGSNDLTMIGANTFSGLSSLTTLFLDDNSLTTLPANVFSGLSGLTRLDLTSNDLTMIEANALSGLSSLTGLDLGSNDLTTIEANTFSGLTSLAVLNLRDNDLIMIGANTFSGLSGLTTLFLDDNSLTTLPANAFSSLTSLTVLNLRDNALTMIEANTFSGLSSLVTLFLDDNSLTTLPANAFSGLSSLNGLGLADNNLTTIEANTFSGLSSLITLFLNNNDLITIEANAFSSLTSLTGLGLDGNDLTMIESNTFSGLTSLTILNLRDNDLTTIEANALSGLSSLTGLSLQDNDLTALPADLFSGLGSLTTLLLGANTFTTPLPTDLFADLPNDALIEIDLAPIGDLADIPSLTVSGTTTINVADAFISKDSTGTDRDLTYSTMLSGTSVATATVNGTVVSITASNTPGMTEVSITANDSVTGARGMSTRTITVTVMEDIMNICSRTAQVQTAILAAIPGTPDCTAVTAAQLAAIADLNLFNTSISTLQSGDFAGLTSLTTLDLEFNALTTIEANTFSDLTNLTTLDLNRNDLTTIEANTFSGLTSLTRLDLSSNSLTTLPAGVFDGLISLTFLSLDNNALTTIEADTFSGLTSLEILLLGFNVLTTIEANTFSGLMSLGELYLESNALTTIEADTFSGLTSLNFLFLDDNDLTTIEAGTFSGLTSLNLLWLHDNTFTTPLPANIFNDLSSFATIRIDLSPIGDLAVALGTSGMITIDPADAFISRDGSGNDRDLSYSAVRSNDTAVATVSESGGMLTITATGNGATTVSVTASDGVSTNAMNDIAVTVEMGMSICDRTNQVETAILAAIPASPACDAVTAAQLAAITGDLNLFRMGITTLQSGDFAGLTSLTTLDLEGNDLTTLEANAFSGLTSLSILSLSSNDLFTIEAGTFSGLMSLTVLTLSNNALTALPDGLFSGLGSLATLRLQGNPFTTPLPADIFDPLPNDATIEIDLAPIGDLDEVALTVGGTTTINVADAFISRDSVGDDRTITYTLTPADTNVATATESSGVVTITGAGMGTTTVSVLADDGRSGTVGMHTRDITVTVVEMGILAFDEATGNTAATVVAAENNGTDMVYVQLASAPTSDVTMTVMSSAMAEGTVTPSELTFTAMNWNTRQAVTITAVPDQIDRDDTFTVDFMITSGDGGDYPDTLTLSSVQVTITDDDTAGIDGYDMATGGSEITAIATSEAGDAITTYVQLTSQPTGTVTVTIDGIDTTEHTLTTPASGTLTFDSTNWNTPRQLITITGVDDNIVDGDQTYTLTLTATGGGYDGVVETGLVTNSDDDTATLSIADMSVDEDASTATLTVTLTPAVTAGDVMVDLTTADATAEAGADYTALTSETLTITAGTISQTLDITINDDTIDEVDETFTAMLDNLMLPTGLATSDVSITDATAIVTITDDDTISDTISLSVSPSTVAETADATTITVIATIEGTAVSTTATNVTVSVGGGTATSGTDYAAVSDFTLTIPALSLSAMATFMIDPTEDTTDDNNETVMISGTAGGFTTVNTADLTIVEAGISVFDAMTAGSQISTFTITEASSDTFYVELVSQPVSNVILTLTSSASGEGTVTPPTLTFTTMNWNTRQALTITAVDDNVDRDGDSFMVEFAVMSGTGNYDPATLTTLPSVAVTVTDDDTAGIAVAIGDDVTTSETGTADTFTVVLDSEPTAEVTVEITGLRAGEHSLTPSSTLTFTTTEWNRAQTVTLTGINDNDVDGDQTYALTLTATGGGYAGVMAETVSITNTDDDTATLSIADLSVDENAGTATLTVTLTPAVTAGDVMVDLTTTDSTATSTDYTAIISETLTITAGSTSETLSVTINDDNIAEGDETFTVMLDNLVQPTGITTVSITDATAIVTITDGDTAGITTAIGDGVTTSETGTSDTFTVVLDSEPTDTVTVTITGLRAGEHSLTPSSTLTFTTTDWNRAQTVTLTGVNDNDVDGNQTYALTLTASGGGYTGVTAETVSITNTNDDTAVLTISDSLISVDENAGTATVTVTLSAPVTAGDIEVELTTADDTAEAGEDYTALISETLTITAGSTSETLDIPINDDNIAEGDENFTVTLSSVTVPAAVVSDVGPSDNATTITITDDDVTPTMITLSVSQPTIAETADATTITVTATIVGTVVLATPTDISVSVGSATDSATEGTDYVTVPDFDLTIPALMTSATQTFMIDPTDDTADDNNEVVTISGTAPGFTTVTPTTLTIVEAGISVFESQTSTTQISTATIAEASSDTFYVELVSQPVSNVILTLTSSASGEGTVTPPTLTFTTMNWNTRQALTITAVDDNVDRDGDSFMVEFAVMSGTGNYDPATLTTLPSVAVTVSDDDTPSTDITLTISRDSIQETAGETSITVTATLGGAVSTIPTEVIVTVGDSGDTADEGSDYMEIPDFILTIPALMTSGNGVFTITPIADNENDNEETITISGMASINSNPVTINTATLTITGFSEEEQQVIEQTVAAQASSVTQVVSENIGSFLASRTSAPAAAPAPPAPDGGGGGDVKRENFTSIDWQDWQHRFAKLAYEGIQRLDSDADMSLDWALKAAGGDGRLLMPLGVESLTLWAAGGRLKTKGDGMGEYDGGVNSFVVGVDTNLINNWLLGIAASYSDSQVDYTMDGNPLGATEQNLFSVHPFLSHSLPDHGLTLWVTGGYGVGDIDFSHTTNGEAASDVTQWMAAGGIEKHIITNTLWQGALRLKGLWGNAEVDATEYDNGVDIRKVESTFWRARMESEMGYNFQLPGANVRPYALIGGRWDHNDAIVSGDEWHIDIGGGVEVLSGNAFALNISVHTQLTDGDTEEDSIVGTGSLTYDIGHDRQGLQITLSRPLNNTSPSWDQHSFNEITNTASGINSAPLTSELAYGWTVRPFGLEGALQTYTQARFDSSERHYAVGLELAVNALTLNFESGYGEADNTGLESMLKTKIRW